MDLEPRHTLATRPGFHPELTTLVDIDGVNETRRVGPGYKTSGHTRETKEENPVTRSPEGPPGRGSHEVYTGLHVFWVRTETLRPGR